MSAFTTMPHHRSTHIARHWPTKWLLCTSLLAGCQGGSGNDAASAPAPTPPPQYNTQLRLSLPDQGLRASQLGLVVAQGDALSEAVAAEYARVRGVPPGNIVKVILPSTEQSMSAADFAAIKAAVDAQLGADVQATLITWAVPTRVQGEFCSVSITSAMAWGYDAKACVSSKAPSPCLSTRNSPYFGSEVQRPFQEMGWRPSMLLGATSLEGARTLIQRGLQADGSQPSGTVYLVSTDDAMRNIRAADFHQVTRQWLDSGLRTVLIDNAQGQANNSLSPRTDVLAYFTGLPQVSDLNAHQYRPGAVGDSLTSFAGLLPDARGQTPATAWLDAGLTGTYGTVEEPCNFGGKFPKVSVLLDQYFRGASLIEAYWKSVDMPGQGLFIGDPLARPWPDNPSLEVVGNNYQLNTRRLRPNARYALEFRSASGDWKELATIQPTSAAPKTWTLPLPPVDAVQIRWRGPCPLDLTQTCTLASSPS
ncbi:TIGR03790 family protein [Roseateles sp. BYS180W]|uniref:TIGR03790 family protein n=1 Tax=Roseateles rivi TaxID=3299028 RepID=A0ABW7FW21_9BURK